MGSSRLPRFKRSPQVAPLQLTERDHEIIRLIHRHRFLRSTQIADLMGNPAQPLLRRLQLLYHHGYLERPRAQLDYYHQGGSRPMIYGLGNKGAALLKTKTPKLRWSEKNRSVERLFLKHALLVSDVMVALELACLQGGQVRLLTEQELFPPTLMKRPSFRWGVKIANGIRLGLIPDRVFALERADGTRAYFFLEADRGTMPVTRKNLSQTSFYRKLLAYEATWTQSLHKRLFGFHRFRVLTVTTSVARVQSLVAACSQLKRGHGLFLFADETILQNPADLFTALWQTRQPGKLGRLLD